MAKQTLLHIPDIGDAKGVEVIEILVKPGERVAKDQSLITLESDKASMEVPSPVAGVVREIRVAVGEKVSEGHPMAVVETEGAAPAVPAVPDSSPSAPASPQSQSVRIPDIGDAKGVEVIEILVKPGERVAKDQSLITLESDKASMEVPSPVAGVVREIRVAVGEKVSEGHEVLILDTDGAVLRSVPAQAPPSVAQSGRIAAAPTVPRPAPAPLLTPALPAGGLPHASPSVRLFARELGADLRQIVGTGPKGRILKTDVQAWIKQRLQQSAAGGLAIAPMPTIDFAAFGPVRTTPRTRIQKLSASYLHRAWVSIPHVTHHDRADITELEDFRKSTKDTLADQGVKLTLLPFLVRAVVGALKAHPDVNASLDPSGEFLIHKDYHHIGIAVDTPEGLVVPVLRRAGDLGVAAMARELSALGQRARDKKLRREEIEGGTFTLSSLGGVGGQFFTPIINAPEVAILGICPAALQPVWHDDAFVPRLMLPLSLSYDHRVIDGAAAARFMNTLKEHLADAGLRDLGDLAG